MSASPSPAPPADLVARLRAAGCVFAEDEARLLLAAARTPADLAALVDRRAAGSPLEYVLGWAEFCGLRIAVVPGVFVPRRRTEFLVRQAVALLTAGVVGSVDGADQVGPVRPAGVAGPGGGAEAVPGRRPTVVDLCCGSGAVGAALAAAVDGVDVHAVDIDPVAVRCARGNAPAGGQVYEGDLFTPLPAELRGGVDVLVANTPYVPTEAIASMPREARDHEPRVALDGGADGLDIARRVAAAAAGWLRPGGHLLIETSERQAPHLVDAFTRHGLRARVAGSDELSATVVLGAKPG